jgi:hypothetical protein
MQYQHVSTYALFLFFVFVLLAVESRGECCFDADSAYTGLDLVRLHVENPYDRDLRAAVYNRQYTCYRGLAPSGSYATPYDNIVCDKEFLDCYYCRDLNPRVGSYCGKGSCNPFGCSCKGGCIQGGKRRMLGNPNSTEAYVPEDLSDNAIATCQRTMVEKYNSTSLVSEDQIMSYFECLDSSGDGALYPNELGIESRGVLNQTVSSVDGNNDGYISMAEFDPQLSENQTSVSSRASTRTCMALGYLLLLYTVGYNVWID